MTVEKVGKEWHHEKLFDNQKRENVWVYKGFAIFQFRNFPSDKVTVTPVNNPISPVKGGFGPDFPELSWIRADAFVKTVMYNGQRCHYYEDTNAPPLAGGDELNFRRNPRAVRAWINAKTRLPVAVEDACHA